MSDYETFDLAKVTARAWSQLQTRLGVRLAALPSPSHLSLDVDTGDEETGAYVQFVLMPEVVAVEATSNEYLTGPHVLTPAQEAALVELGFERPTVSPVEAEEGEGSANFRLFAPRDDVQRLALLAVTVLRDVLAVPHPAFLRSPGLLDEPSDDVVGRVDLADEPVAVMPTNRTHLDALVDDALVQVFDKPPVRDDDGDVPVASGSVLVFVRVSRNAPTIELFAQVVSDITDLDRARFEIGVLNRDARLVRYSLIEDRVIGSWTILAAPFVAEHLRAAVELFIAEIDAADDDLAVRVGGRRHLDAVMGPATPTDGEDDEDDDDDEEELHPAMLTLLQLDAETPGSVDPETAASVCGDDRGLILELIRWNEEQEISWRAARDLALADGDAAEAEVCDHEMRHGERTASLLRRALRVVVDRDREAAKTRRTRPAPPA